MAFQRVLTCHLQRVFKDLGSGTLDLQRYDNVSIVKTFDPQRLTWKVQVESHPVLVSRCNYGLFLRKKYLYFVIVLISCYLLNFEGLKNRKRKSVVFDHTPPKLTCGPLIHIFKTLISHLFGLVII